jgi:site-specific DNA recombinase
MNTEVNNKTRAAIYLRVSTDEQVKGYGLSFQEEKLRAFISSQDQSLSENNVYKDEGYSGTIEIMQRPALKKLFDDAKNKEFDVVYVYRLDRFFRKTKLLLGALDELGNFKVGFRSITESFDTTNITGKFMTTLLGAVAEMERDTIRERTVNGRIAAAKSGKWVVGLPPYGYIRNPETQKLEIVGNEAETVRQLYEWLVYEKLSLKAIARRMNESGINSPKYVFINKRKTYNHWYERTIGRILSNEIYTGVTYFRKYKRPFRNAVSVVEESLKRPENEWIRIEVPPIISRELFDKAIKQLIDNKDNASRNMKQNYMFSKLLYCGYCGFKLLSGYQPPRKGGSGIGTKYYHGVYRKRDAIGTTKRCEKCPQYAENRLEPIWYCLKEILEKPKNLEVPIEKYYFKLENKEDVDKKIESNNEKIKILDNKIHRLGMIFVNNESVSLTEFKKMEKECLAEKEALIECNLKLRQSLETKKDVRNREVLLRNLYNKIKKRLNDAIYDDRKYLLHLFISKITIFAKSNRAEVLFKFPITEFDTKVNFDNAQGNMPLFLNIKTYSANQTRNYSRSTIEL